MATKQFEGRLTVADRPIEDGDKVWVPCYLRMSVFKGPVSGTRITRDEPVQTLQMFDTDAELEKHTIYDLRGDNGPVTREEAKVEGKGEASAETANGAAAKPYGAKPAVVKRARPSR